MVNDLSKEEMVSLLRGTEPESYDAMIVIPNDVGHLVGGMGERWEWLISEDSDYTCEEIYDFYKLCKMTPKEIHKKYSDVFLKLEERQKKYDEEHKGMTFVECLTKDINDNILERIREIWEN